jgi:TonB family protein
MTGSGGSNLKSKPPVAVETSQPAYTEAARNAKLEGRVVLRVNIGTDGLAHDIEVVQSLGYGLDDSAVECASHWRFRPGTANGVPVTVPATILFFFKLEEPPNDAERFLSAF